MMNFHVKMLENERNKKFRDKQTTDKILLMFLVLEVLREW